MVITDICLGKMKFIDDICASIAGNAKTRINDPFVGAFVCSWLVCNWNQLSLLFWGNGKASERIDSFYNYLSVTPFWGWNHLFVIPFSIAVFYLFIFPWLSILINFLQHWANEGLHKQAVSIELVKINQQKNLNKEKLKSNPNKQFLEQLVQQDIDKQNLVLEHIRQRTARLEAKTIEAKDKEKEQKGKAQEAEHKENIARLELEKKSKQFELEKLRFESDSAKARATHASNRFPSAYYLMFKIEESLSEDDIHVSLNALGAIVAALFGYENFDELLNDNNFNNETLAKVKYVYYDDGLAKRLEQIVLDESSENEGFSADIIFNHFEMLFDDEPFRLIAGDSLAEECMQEFENDRYGIFNGEGLSGAIAESDTVFDTVEDISLEQFNFNEGFDAELSANASGEHYREEGISGRTMTISITMHCDVLLGKFGLGSIEQSEVSGTLDDFE